MLALTLLFFIKTACAQNQQEDFLPTIKFGAGIFIPQENLKNYFGVSPYFEINVQVPFFKKDNFGFSFQFVIPNQQKNFSYITVHNEIEKTKATYIANIVFNFRKSIFKTEKSAFEFMLGVGASGLQTDLRNPRYSGHKDENKYEMIDAFLLNPSLNYNKIFKDKTELSFAFGIQYSPYKIEGAVQENIGGFAFIPKLLFTF